MPADRRDEEKQGLLSAVGLIGANDETVWRALMRFPDDDVHEIAKRVALRESDVRLAVQTLLDAHLLSPSSKPSGASAIDPRIAVEAHIARAEQRIAQRSVALADLRAQVATYVGDYEHGRTRLSTVPVIEMVVDLDDLRQRVYLASEAVASVQRTLHRSPSGEGLRHGREVDMDQLGRGVEVRTIIGTTDLTDPDVYSYLKQQHAVGERVRALSYVPTQLHIMDTELAVVAVEPTQPRRGALFIREPGIVELLIYLFDHLWSEADCVFTEVGAPGAPTGRTARILELMGAGVKDERIARTLGVGARTVRRDIAALRAQLGVSSRPEIVAAAVRNGWLS